MRRDDEAVGDPLDPLLKGRERDGGVAVHREAADQGLDAPLVGTRIGLAEVGSNDVGPVAEGLEDASSEHQLERCLVQLATVEAAENVQRQQADRIDVRVVVAPPARGLETAQKTPLRGRSARCQWPALSAESQRRIARISIPLHRYRDQKAHAVLQRNTGGWQSGPWVALDPLSSATTVAAPPGERFSNTAPRRSRWVTDDDDRQAAARSLGLGGRVDAACAPRCGPESREQLLVDESRIVVEVLLSSPMLNNVRVYMQNAYGALLVPGLLRGGFLIGVEHGTGVMVARDPKSGVWSDPAVSICGVAASACQLGGQSSTSSSPS